MYLANNSWLYGTYNTGFLVCPGSPFIKTTDDEYLSESEETQIISDRVIVYPNPTRGELLMEFESSGEQQAELLVTDLTGRLVVAETINLHSGFNQVPVNISDRLPGVYILKIYTATGYKVFRVIKE